MSKSAGRNNGVPGGVNSYYGFAGTGYDDGNNSGDSYESNKGLLTKSRLQSHTTSVSRSTSGSMMDAFPFGPGNVNGFSSANGGSDNGSLGISGFGFAFDNDEVANGYGSNGSGQSVPSLGGKKSSNGSTTANRMLLTQKHDSSSIAEGDYYPKASSTTVRPQQLDPMSQLQPVQSGGNSTGTLQQQQQTQQQNHPMLESQSLQNMRMAAFNHVSALNNLAGAPSATINSQPMQNGPLHQQNNIQRSIHTNPLASMGKIPSPSQQNNINDTGKRKESNSNNDLITQPRKKRSITFEEKVNDGDECSSSIDSSYQKKKSESKDASNKKSKSSDDSKREERNLREKERSLRISQQINDLRDLLSSGGVVIPKGTKSSVLTEAANYIRILQQHQYQSEMDRYQLVQQVQKIGGGALGPNAAQAVRHVAAQNGVWSLGNFGGLPPRSALVQPIPSHVVGPTPQDPRAITVVHDGDYRKIFNSCGVGMAIASMGGAFIDCNELFCQLSQYTKQELCSMTIFNLTSREDLQNAFDIISSMISPATGNILPPKQCVLRGSMKSRDDLGLSVAIIRSDEGVAKCFCVTLIQGQTGNHEQIRPVSFSYVDNVHKNRTQPSLRQSTSQKKPQQKQNSQQAPYYTTG